MFVIKQDSKQKKESIEKALIKFKEWHKSGMLNDTEYEIMCKRLKKDLHIVA